jgi:molybdopterin-guanine dinucleotide biosynthesis protein A
MASAAILVGGRTIRERQLEALAPVTDVVLIVGPCADVGRTAGPAEAGPRRGRYIVDRVPGSGPLGGLDAARDDLLILLACDVPFVTSAFLDYLVTNAAGVDAVVPRTDRGYHPLCAVYTRACRETVAERHLALTGLIETVRTRVIEPEDVERFGPGRRLLANVNTPDEFDELVALLGHKL